jgi:translation initiation factor 2B subunit (eIF-2B alpha/beta/delta family)
MTSINSHQHQLNRILDNKTLGSSELVKLLNSYFLSIYNNKSEIGRNVKTAKLKLGHFEAVNSYLNNLSSELKNGSGLLNFLKIYAQQQEDISKKIFNKIYPGLKELSSVITLSRSGTVLEILKLWYQKNKKIKIIVCESRPKFEGRLLAEALAKSGIGTALITDAMMSLYVKEADAAIIGADLILSNGNVVNKVGSRLLALLCKEHKKPFYVLASKSKLSKEKIFKSKNENPDEVWTKKIKKLSISNIYFEEIEKNLISKIFTE